MTPLLRADGITKGFGGISALEDVSIEVGRGEAVGLVGPNGAGKTTLFNCLLGVSRPDAGQVRFDGRDITHRAIWRRARMGIGRTFQRLELFPELTVREHLAVAERVRLGSGSLVKDLVNRAQTSDDERAAVEEVISLLGLEAEADRPVEACSLGRGRMVELGRALVGRPRLLMLDEPSSGLDREQSRALADRLRTVQQQRETAVLIVEHDLDVVTRVASRLYVLDFGRVLAAGPTDEVLADPTVRQAYLGKRAAS